VQPSTPVRWGQGSHTFELQSPDAAVLARAAIVFRPWARQGQPSTTWTIAPDTGAQTWRLRADHTDDIVVRGDAPRAVTAIEALSLLRLLDGPPEVLSLHAALLASPEGRGLLIVGPNGAGKSTAACALWMRGFSLLGDDVALIDADSLTASSGPRRVSLRSSSQSLLGDVLWSRIASAPASDTTVEGYVFHPEEVDERPRPLAARLAACVFLARSGAVPTGGVCRRIEPAQAALALLPYSNLIRRQDAGTALARIAPLAAALPAYDLDRGPLSEMSAAIERLLDGGR
jgi:hypothetical protein